VKRIRVIPALLLKGDGLVKTVRFDRPTYVGDPLNAVKIFNEKEVDELVFLDITATREGRAPSITRISEIATECFMPLGYGGGITTVDQIQEILETGVEKVVLNTSAVHDPQLVKEAARRFGSQAIVASIDVRKSWLGRYRVEVRGATEKTGYDPVHLARELERLGAGEILLNSIDREGTFSGYDVPLIRSVADAVRVPVIALGGAGKVQDFRTAVVEGGASAVAAGSLFVFHGPHRAVLINYPTQEVLRRELFEPAGANAA